MDYVYSDKTKCCGCAACARSCLTGAIVMLADAEGFIYPKINKTQCVDCGLCHKVCPYIDNEVVENFHPHYKCYAATHKDRAVLERSSSGGVFTALSDIILEQDGAVYGCGYTEQLKAIHMRATSTTERDNLCGSKYVQSEIDDSFIYVRDDLRNGLHVLFMGTPCQIAGLLLFLYGENTSNLLTVSLICHGVPSPKLFAEYLDYCNKRRNAKIVEYHHRSKNNYWAHIECSKFVYNNGDSDSDSDSLMSQAW
ncbi:MAG: Coenzyme F420 hydrogenase/dehydrogenase, beta subunit C-terminal domain, partial [Oscillospiraceae bacterium]|nr:Coenzyme F420 hydrogenase/dehydrogenase, beta subunit C-terminal domain [Oscillospiraceae bacterium]